MDLKRIGRALLYPPIAVPIVLTPIAAVLTVLVMTRLEPQSGLAIAAYLLAFYTLTLWCVRIPRIVAWCRNFRETNRYALRWRSDVRLRVKFSLYGTFFWNAGYAILQLGLGIRHGSSWYYSLAAYYVMLAVMRFFLLRHTARYEAGEDMRRELWRYCICGSVFLVMNLALSTMIVYIVFRGKTFHHHEITTIAMAAYTFVTFTRAVINAIKYRRYNSPVYSAAKAISLASACVSMLTLEATMLTTFEGETATPAFRQLMLGLSGGAVSMLIVAMAVYMIVNGSRRLHAMTEQSEQR